MKAKGYLYVFGMGMQKAMAYRADFFLGLVSCLFPIVMQVFLWNALYAAGAAEANGYTYEQMMLYTLLAGVTARIVATGFENEVAAGIKTGGLNRYLVKPMDHGRYTLAQFLGGKAAGIALLLAVTAAVLSAVLPFGYTTQFCVNIVSGRLGWGGIGCGLLMQLGWCAVFTGLHALLWRRGVRRYAAVGG